MTKEKKKKAPPQNGRAEAVNKAVSEIIKRYGDGSIMLMGESTSLEVDVIPTGALSIDLALGVGGIPKGRVSEIYGPESSGKTTLCQHIVAECQKQGGVAAFIDMEHALDPTYAACCGVDIDSMLISQPDTGEQALEITETLVRSGAIDLIIIDSVAALVPRSELEGDMGQATMGVQARLMSQAMRKLSGIVKQTNTALIFTNQLRQKIGVMFGNPETTTGGMALKFYSSVRIDIRRIQSIKSGTDIIGNRTRVRVVKNKVAPPFRSAEFDIMYNEGISKTGDILDLAVESEIIQKRGSYYSYGETRFGQGRENTKAYLIENPSLVFEIEKLIRAEVLGEENSLFNNQVSEEAPIDEGAPEQFALEVES
jgi:recombination protein RecA